MARKVYVDVTVRLIINAEENVKISNVIQEMDYNFTSNHDDAEIVDTEIINFYTVESE